MGRAIKKFRTKHKFGKRVRRSLAENFRKRPATTQDNEDDELAAASGAVVDASAAGLTDASPTSPSVADNVAESGRVRHDTQILQPQQIEDKKKKAEEKLREISSVAATERKRSLIAKRADAVGPPPDETTFTILDLEAVNALIILHLKCKICNGDAEIRRGEREYGLAVKLELVCVNCGDGSSKWSSPRVDGQQKINPFTVNVLATRAMQATGNRQTAFNDIFAMMNISRRGLHTKTWQAYVKKKLTPAATLAASKLMSECASSVRDIYAELNVDNPGNIAVSYDGSWMTRGHSSHIGVGTVIELISGLVLDYVVLSNFCAGCESGPKEGDPAYEEWKENHVCQRNTTKKAGEMEVEAGLILFKRSLERHSVRYTTVLSDGDSRTYLALQEENVYGYIPITKEDCVNHVKKRMGTALRNLVDKHKKSTGLESLSGKGRLTGDLINKLSSYYGWALKSHDDVDAMQRAVMATYYHVTSNDEVANHTFCPTGTNSWCRQNAADAKGEPAPKHPRSLPPHVCEALLPIYQRLSDKKLLQRCQRGKTQNSNECLHSMIWALAPKDRHASLFTVEAAVAEAVMKFNAGNERSSAGILKELGLNPGIHSSKRMAEKDCRRSVASASKRSSADNLQQNLKKRHAHANNQSDYMPGAY